MSVRGPYGARTDTRTRLPRGWAGRKPTAREGLPAGRVEDPHAGVEEGGSGEELDAHGDGVFVGVEVALVEVADGEVARTADAQAGHGAGTCSRYQEKSSPPRLCSVSSTDFTPRRATIESCSSSVTTGSLTTGGTPRM